MTSRSILLSLIFYIAFVGAAAASSLGFLPLPAGTLVNYDSWSFKVKEQEGEITTIESWQVGDTKKRVFQEYAGQVRYGDNVLSVIENWGTSSDPFTSKIEGAGKTEILNLFPLAVGKRAVFQINDNYIPSDTAWGTTFFREWKGEIEVVGIDTVAFAGLSYETFIIKRTLHTPAESSTSGFGGHATLAVSSLPYLTM